MDSIASVGTGGITTATPLRVFLSHTSDLGRPDEAEGTGPHASRIGPLMSS